MYRYAFAFGGASYSAGYILAAGDAILATSLADVRQILLDMRRGRAYAPVALGGELLPTPGFGEPGDWAQIYRLPIADADRYAAWNEFASACDVGGDPYPDYVAEFGPRGGLRIERA